MAAKEGSPLCERLCTPLPACNSGWLSDRANPAAVYSASGACEAAVLSAGWPGEVVRGGFSAWLLACRSSTAVWLLTSLSASPPCTTSRPAPSALRCHPNTCRRQTMRQAGAWHTCVHVAVLDTCMTCSLHCTDCAACHHKGWLSCSYLAPAPPWRPTCAGARPRGAPRCGWRPPSPLPSHGPQRPGRSQRGAL